MGHHAAFFDDAQCQFVSILAPIFDVLVLAAFRFAWRDDILVGFLVAHLFHFIHRNEPRAVKVSHFLIEQCGNKEGVSFIIECRFPHIELRRITSLFGIAHVCIGTALQLYGDRVTRVLMEEQHV